MKGSSVERRNRYALLVKLIVLTALSALLMLPASASGLDRGRSEATYDGVTSSTAKARARQVKVIKYWTQERMLAAHRKALPKVRAAGAGDVLGVSDDPIGEPGKVKGRVPKQARQAAGTSTQSRVEPTSYTYPFPFTRYFVDPQLYPGVYPYIAVGKLFFTQNGGNYVCSAASVASTLEYQAVWTAGHCVSDGAGTWSTNVAFVPSYRNGVAPYGIFPASVLWSTTAWHQDGDITRDLGAFPVGTNAAGQTLQSRVGSLGFAWNFPRTSHWSDFGYPQAAPFNGAWMVVCQASHAYDDITIPGTGPDPMAIGCDMTGGSSGGPFIRNFKSGNFINGHNSYKYVNPALPLAMFTPYFDTLANQLRCAAANISGC